MSKVMSKISSFEKKVNRLAFLRKPVIAFGLASPDPTILRSIKAGKKYAKIILVGAKVISKIKGFDLEISEDPEKKLASMLANREVDGIIRGTIDDFKTIETYEKLTGEKHTTFASLVEDPTGRQFFLALASNPEGWNKEDRLRITLEIAKFMKSWGIQPKIAVFTGERHETYPRKKHIRTGVVGILNKTYEDAEWIVEKLKNEGYQAKNWAIDLNPAVEANWNLMVPVNGMVSNQIFRVILFCGGKLLACTILGYTRAFEDTSRTEKDFEFHIKWLAAMINRNPLLASK